MALVQQEIANHKLNLVMWPAVRNATRPFMGISQAHKRVVRYARRLKQDMVCVAEDDFHLTAPGAWEYFLQNIPTVFDIYLSGIYFGYINKENVVKQFCGLHLYIVHNRFYNTFLSIDENNNLDQALNGKGKFVVCDPFIAIQHDGYSDHKGKHATYGHLLKGRRIYK